MLTWLKGIFGGAASATSGGRGEQAAADWLRRTRGFSVVARNWRSPHDRRDEIDLVCRDGEVLVFIEVKTRAAGALVPGYYAAVNPRKKKVLQRAARAYLAGLREKPRTFRLDVVEVVFPAGGAGEPEVTHFENVPLFPKHFRG